VSAATLEAAGFPPDQAAELDARIRAEVATWPRFTDEQRAELAGLLDLSGDQR